MNSSKTLRIATLLVAVVAMTTNYRATAQQETDPEGQTLHVMVGKSVIINVQAPLKRVLSSNPAIIETVATSPTQLVVEGKAAGAGTLILWDATGQSQILDVVVDIDVASLRTAIEHAYPNQHVAVEADGGRLILTGNVADPRMSEDVSKMASHFSSQVVNSLTVPVTHGPQVLLEVKFAEVDRTRLDRFGVNIISTGATNTIGTVSTQQFSPPQLSVSGSGSGSGSGGGTIGNTNITVSDPLNIFLFRPDINLATTIRALQAKNILQILAEPNLLAMNGEKASFLAGGEFPFPVVQGGVNVGAVTIQFRPFGVRLDFTGYIDPDNVIRLHVAPEVSTLDFTNALVISGFTVPALSTRRAETDIELNDGQSFGIAGLLDQRAQAQFNKVPGIGDIPILGQLFRSRDVNRSNTELLVLVTPHVVNPVKSPSPAKAEPKVVVPFLDNPQFDKGVPGHTQVETPQTNPSPK